jgi:hypothetical protein
MNSLLPNVLPEFRGFAASYLAKVKLDQAKESFEKLKAVQIPSNLQMQKSAVEKKLNLLQTIEDQLLKIIKYNSSSEIVSSLSLFGEANQHMAFTFQATPLPQGLNEEQNKLYKEKLNERITQFVNEADKSFKLSVKRASDLEAYNEDFRRTYIYLSKKFPAEYANSFEKTINVKKIDWMAGHE